MGLWFLRHDEVLSYAVARLKSDYGYRNKDPRRYWIRDETDIRKTLADERHQELIAPGGAWWRFVQMYLAEPTGMPTGWLNWRPNRRELLRRFWGGAAGSSTGEPLPGFRGSAGRMRSAPGLRCMSLLGAGRD